MAKQVHPMPLFGSLSTPTSLLVSFQAIMLGSMVVWAQQDTSSSAAARQRKQKQNHQSDSSSVNDEQVKAMVDRDIHDNSCVLYVFTHCPYCMRAKSILLEKYGAAVKVVALDQEGSVGVAIREELQRRTGRTSVPSIWVGGHFLGGCSDGPQEVHSSSGRVISTAGGLVSLDKEGVLRELLEEAGALPRKDL
eukprot:gene1558-1697_t